MKSDYYLLNLYNGVMKIDVMECQFHFHTFNEELTVTCDLKNIENQNEYSLKLINNNFIDRILLGSCDKHTEIVFEVESQFDSHLNFSNAEFNIRFKVKNFIVFQKYVINENNTSQLKLVGGALNSLLSPMHRYKVGIEDLTYGYVKANKLELNSKTIKEYELEIHNKVVKFQFDVQLGKYYLDPVNIFNDLDTSLTLIFEDAFTIEELFDLIVKLKNTISFFLRSNNIEFRYIYTPRIDFSYNDNINSYSVDHNYHKQYNVKSEFIKTSGFNFDIFMKVLESFIANNYSFTKAFEDNLNLSYLFSTIDYFTNKLFQSSDITFLKSIKNLESLINESNIENDHKDRFKNLITKSNNFSLKSRFKMLIESNEDLINLINGVLFVDVDTYISKMIKIRHSLSHSLSKTINYRSEDVKILNVIMYYSILKHISLDIEDINALLQKIFHYVIFIDETECHVAFLDSV